MMSNNRAMLLFLGSIDSKDPEISALGMAKRPDALELTALPGSAISG